MIQSIENKKRHLLVINESRKSHCQNAKPSIYANYFVIQKKNVTTNLSSSVTNDCHNKLRNSCVPSLKFFDPPPLRDSHQYNSYKFIQTIHSLTMTSTFSGNLTSCKYKTQILKKVYTCIYAKSDASHEIHLKFPSELQYSYNCYHYRELNFMIS